MIPWLLDAKYVDGHRVYVAFNDGSAGEIDLADDLDGPIFEPLRDPTYFRNFHLEGHTLAWDNGADFAPEYLYEKLLAASMTNH